MRFFDNLELPTAALRVFLGLGLGRDRLHRTAVCCHSWQRQKGMYLANQSTMEVRSLGSSERFFWTMSQMKPINFSLVVSFLGTQPEGSWKSALKRVQACHPLLGTNILRDAEGELRFAKLKGASLPLTVKKREHAEQWQRELEEEAECPFANADSSLLRATLLEGGNRSDLILTAHHSIADGVALLSLLRDLLASMAGESLTTRPVPASAEALAAKLPEADAPAPQPHEEHASEHPARPLSYRGASGQAHVRALRLSAEQTALFLESAHREKTTVNAALFMALILGLRQVSPELGQADLRAFWPVDVRDLLHNENDFSLSIAVGRAVSRYPYGDFWEDARAFAKQLAPFQTARAVAATFERMDGIMSKKPDPAVLAKGWAQSAGYDLMLTNLKVAFFPKIPDGLKVDAVWGPSELVGLEGEQTVGAITFEGALHLTYTSDKPYEGLLGSVQAILAEVCSPTVAVRC